MYFDLLMSPKKHSQLIPRLTSRQSWSIASDAVAYPDRRGKVRITEDLYQDILNYVLYREDSIELASKIFLCNEKMLACMLF